MRTNDDNDDDDGEKKSKENIVLGRCWENVATKKGNGTFSFFIFPPSRAHFLEENYSFPLLIQPSHTTINIIHIKGRGQSLTNNLPQFSPPLVI